eukprot:scaffold257717_cov58-Attheya_sp.AAC.2
MEVPDVPGQRTNFMFAAIHEAKGQIFTDQPGRFLVASITEPMPSRTTKSILEAYKRAHSVLI